ncbi:hypothetical protein GLAREA_10733 [Glarea lozoyensis ATCC 20868]|uniref:Uncharacterized protein n=1 Tax=Glarea lozoyensis (strain ATCC 20868 / MF5171) TaxID=1116229 RepID=S3E9N9_GLAL2|nr:uncharacterized protein GLAREA_10733 [Glarea lozoyensis ATCC 20868]EPE35038.1 hypothetical protein GLAREA_10733 [Glarea lozoyensis ATCC 20868]
MQSDDPTGREWVLVSRGILSKVLQDVLDDAIGVKKYSLTHSDDCYLIKTLKPLEENQTKWIDHHVFKSTYKRQRPERSRASTKNLDECSKLQGLPQPSNDLRNLAKRSPEPHRTGTFATLARKMETDSNGEATTVTKSSGGNETVDAR